MPYLGHRVRPRRGGRDQRDDAVVDGEILQRRVPAQEWIGRHSGANSRLGKHLCERAGLALIDDASGRQVGVVTGWQETGGPIVLEIDSGRILVPFVKSILKKIDPAGREIRVELPEGLEDLNGPRPAP